jgi:hypothetical protein
MVRKIRMGFGDWPTLLAIVTPLHLRPSPQQQAVSMRMRRTGMSQQPGAIIVIDNREAAKAGQLSTISPKA